jgi:hypothetical protein
MATIAKLMVELGLEGGAFDRGIGKARASLDSLGESARKWGGILTAGVTLPLAAAGWKAINWAADLDESINKSDKLFGQNAAAVLAWSSTSDKAMGMSQQAALDYSSSFAGMFKTIASGPDQLMEMSVAMTQLTSDFGSFHNLNPEEAFTVISSALAGETEAIRKYGVDVSAAAVETKALQMGLAGTAAELTEADKAMARYQIILDETTDAQGDFADTANSTSNRMKIFQARLQNVGAAFGRHLLPFVNKGLEALENLLGWLDDLSPSMQKWIVGIAAAAAALGPLLIVIGMMLPALSALLGVIGFLLSPIGLVIAAAALLAFVFRDELGAAIGWVIDAFGRLVDSFNFFRSYGADPVTAALLALKTIFPDLSAVITPLIAMVDDLKSAFDAFMDGNFGEGFALIADAARNLWAAIQAAFSAINWGAILTGLGDLAGALGSWLWEQASSVDWGGVIGRAASAAGDITATIVSKLGNLGAALFVWLWNAASAIPWGDVLSAAIAVGDVVTKIIEKLGDLGTSLKTWYDTAIDSVNWAGMGETIGTKIGDLTRTLVPKAGELIQGFLTAVSNPGLWAGIGMALLTLMLALPVAIGYVGMTLAPKALEFLQGFVTGLDINWYLVSMWMITMPMKLLNSVGDLSITLLSKGIELLQGLLDGLNQHWPTIQAWLLLVKDAALAAIGDLSTTLLAKGIELISGFLTGLDQRWPAIVVWLALTSMRAFTAVGDLAATLVARGTELIQGFLLGAVDKWSFDVLPFLKNRGSQAFSHVGALGQTLLPKGRDLITGFLVGATAKWVEVSGWLSGLSGKAVSAVGSLGSTLYNAGTSLIQGLMDGINAMLGPLESLLATITSMIPDIKGPPERDAKLLFPAGRLIMGGLSRGLEDGWQDVSRQLSGYVPTVSGVGDGSFAANGTGAGQTIQIITLEPGKWKEFLENAMAGGTLAREFGPEIAMYGGKPS